MAEVCRFSGITIHIYVNEHQPPHFHVKYAGAEAKIGVADLAVLAGRLPVRQRRMVNTWARRRQAELQIAWQQAQSRQRPGKIAPP